MSEQLIVQAARNNAEWCEAVFRSHGRPGQFLDGIWLNRHPAPPFYGNAVTLNRADPSGQIARIDDLKSDLGGQWGVKDSFNCLDLVPAGFRVLFEASWIFRSPVRVGSAGALDGIRWAIARTSQHLADWEAAWRQDPMNSLEPGVPLLFLPQLAGDENIAFISVYEDAGIIAGAIGNRTGAAAGMSNTFFPAGRDDLRAALVGAVQMTFPGAAIVGYERSGDEIEAYEQLGFRVLAPLRVWVCDPA